MEMENRSHALISGDHETQSLQEPSLRQLEAKNLRGIFESSSISGLPKIVGANNSYSRLFWTILLIAGVIGFAVNMYHLTHRFISEPVLNIQVAEYEKFEWPDIVLCNPMNPISFWRYNATRWAELQNRTKRFYNLRYASKKMNNYAHNILMSSINPHEFRMDRAINMIPFWVIRFDNPGIEPFTDAYYAGNAFTVHDMTNFESRQHVLPFPMPCYSLSTDRQPVLMHKDRYHVLSEVLLPISTNEEDYKKFGCHIDDRGVHLHIIPKNRTIPRRTALLAPGSRVRVSVQMHRTERLKSKTNCSDSIFEVELFDAVLQTSRLLRGTYSDCKSFVTQRHFLEACDCYNPFLPLHRSSQFPPRLCLNATLFSDAQIRANLDCMNKELVKHEVHKEDFVRMLDRECGKFKHPPCQELSYTVTIEASELSENSHKKRERFASQIARFLPGLQAGASMKKVKKNVIFLNVVKASDFGSFNAQELEYGMAQFISDVGGIVGLWIGLSVVGVFELFEMVIASVRYAVVVRTAFSNDKTSV